MQQPDEQFLITFEKFDEGLFRAHEIAVRLQFEEMGRYFRKLKKAASWRIVCMALNIYGVGGVHPFLLRHGDIFGVAVSSAKRTDRKWYVIGKGSKKQIVFEGNGLWITQAPQRVCLSWQAIQHPRNCHQVRPALAVDDDKRCDCCHNSLQSLTRHRRQCPCRLVWYCSTSCQRSNWSSHKYVCLWVRDNHMLPALVE